MMNLKKQGIMGALAGFLISAPSLYGIEENEDPDQEKSSHVRVTCSQNPQEVLIEGSSYKDRLLDCLRTDESSAVKIKNLALLSDLFAIANKYAQAGDEKAMLAMAFTSHRSMETPPEYWVKKLEEKAKAGSAVAQRSLGDIFFHLEPFLDREKGRLYYLMAAAQGDKAARKTLDMIGTLGYGELGACERTDVFLICAR